jgi:serine/threonine protein kinase
MHRTVLDILQGLAFANWVRIRHRDLSPANVLISEDGIVKLSDFGVGKIFDGFGVNEYSNTGTTGAEAIRALECHVNFMGILFLVTFGPSLSSFPRCSSMYLYPNNPN